jgi:hypothetical protein
MKVLAAQAEDTKTPPPAIALQKLAQCPWSAARPPATAIAMVITRMPNCDVINVEIF